MIVHGLLVCMLHDALSSHHSTRSIRTLCPHAIWLTLRNTLYSWTLGRLLVCLSALPCPDCSWRTRTSSYYYLLACEDSSCGNAPCQLRLWVWWNHEQHRRMEHRISIFIRTTECTMDCKCNASIEISFFCWRSPVDDRGLNPLSCECVDLKLFLKDYDATAHISYANFSSN